MVEVSEWFRAQPHASLRAYPIPNNRWRYLAKNTVAPAGQWHCSEQGIGGDYANCNWPEEWL